MSQGALARPTGPDEAGGSGRPAPGSSRPAGPLDDRAILGLLGGLARRVSASLDLETTLHAVAQAAVDALGFEVAVVNLAVEDDQLEVVTVVGPPEVREMLLGDRSSIEVWSILLDAAEDWGRLRFVDHRTAPPGTEEMLSWVPDIPIVDEPDAWHPEDALFALLTAQDGELLGVLSVDVPRDGKRPSLHQRHLLELFAEEAAIAIDHARVYSRLRHSEELFRGVFDRSPVPIAVCDGSWRLRRVNAALCAFLGRTEAELIDHHPLEFTHPDDVDESESLHRQVGGGLASVAFEKRYLRPDGSVVWGRVSITRLAAEEGGGDFEILAQVEDITARKSYEAQLLHEALHDPLTGLANRALVLQRLRTSLADRRRHTAVLFCDVDRFKLVNDVHGHASGDELLRTVASRLITAVRDHDLVGRFGGDEFVVVADHVSNREQALALAARLADAVRVPIEVSGTEVTPSVSIGIARAARGLDPEELLARADTALYRAKAHHRGSFELYNPEMWEEAATELHLREQIPRALEDGELDMHFQPIVALEDGEAVGFEALLRWEHPQLGLLEPKDFLPVVLDTDSVERDITDFAVSRACAALADSGRSDLYVSVNLTPHQLLRPDLGDRVAALLARHGLGGDRLVLELTEDRLMADEELSGQLGALRRLGVRIAIDDFGTGYAGLSYLRRVAADIVKIDRSFVAKLPTDRASASIVTAVVDLAFALGLSVVAEGVESEAQLAALRSAGVGYGQGYLFGRPAPGGIGLGAPATAALSVGD